MTRRQDDPGKRRGRRLGVAAGAAFALLALGVGAATSAAPETVQIQIRSFHFVPPTLEVAAGATVTWVNQDEEIHTITSSDGLFSSPGLDGAQEFSYRFETAGTYEYRCALHPQMNGTVVVR